MRREIVRRAWAKVNLALSVAPPEPPGGDRAGWHRIASWMHAVELHDEVAVTPGDGGELSIAWAPDAARRSPIDWPMSDDLAARAHRALVTFVGRDLPARIRIRKRIPTGGGLGGGSSDAAAALTALNEAFELGLAPSQLRDVGARLGSDVAFFLDAEDPPRPAIVGAFGEAIERVRRREAWLVLLIPPFGCSTRAVYAARDALGPRKLREAEVRTLASGDGGSVPEAGLFNDLAAAAERVSERLGPVRREAAELSGRAVHVTGSGSAMFLFAKDEGEASALRGVLRPLRDCATLMTRLV